MFIFGSLMIGIGIETSGLHQKLALRVVMIVGSEPKWYVLFNNPPPQSNLKLIIQLYPNYNKASIGYNVHNWLFITLDI